MSEDKITAEPHVRPSEVVAQLAISHLEGIEIGTFWTSRADGCGHRVPVTEVTWLGTTLFLRLANGQEFEAEFRVSTPVMRAERRKAEAFAENRADREGVTHGTSG